MTILFDHQVFSWQRTGGISRYFAELLHGLAGEARLPQPLLSSNEYLWKMDIAPRNELFSSDFKGKKMLQNWWGRRSSLHTLKTCAPHVFHPTYFDDYFLKTVENQRVPFVLTVHDMIHERFRHGQASRFSIDFFAIQNKRLLCQRAAAIVTVSEATRSDLLQFFPEIDPQKVHVVWHGNSLQPPSNTDFLMKLPEAYLLFVGGRGGYKNFEGMVCGAVPVLKKYPELRLIFVGGGNFTKTEAEKLKKQGVFEKTICLPHVSDAELSQLYQRAICFIFPSKYEGFGIPILESFACGCPCIVNRASSLPEVGGDAVLYFENDDTDQLSQLIENVLVSQSLQEDLRRRGLQRLTLFSWEKSVAAHRAIYATVSQ